jgi:hypothetical protein
MTYVAPPPPPKQDATGVQEEVRSGVTEGSTPVGKSKDFGATSPRRPEVANEPDKEVKNRSYPNDKPKPTTTGDDDIDLGVDPKKYQMQEEEYGFAHPAASRPQRIVWLPLDPLGLVKEEVKANREAGVDVAAQDAVMNEKGKVDILGPPPDAIQE